MSRFTETERYLILLGIVTIVLGSVMRYQRALRDRPNLPEGNIIEYAAGSWTN